VQLVRLGGATSAPVCDGDACYLPGFAVDSIGSPPSEAEQRPDHEADAEDDQRLA
jgi:hypothetical protein